MLNTTSALSSTAFALALLLLAGCASNQPPNQELAGQVDLQRFMGEWYVHGHTPTPLDREAWNATETYELADDGRILTTYRFRQGSADGEVKVYNPVGRVHDEKTNAEWRMRFFGVVNAAYYILHVSPDYDYTVVGHPDKEHAWIMSREPTISEQAYDRLKGELVEREYNLEEFRRLPQDWSQDQS